MFWLLYTWKMTPYQLDRRLDKSPISSLDMVDKRKFSATVGN
jgi:hypothetical protein